MSSLFYIYTQDILDPSSCKRPSDENNNNDDNNIGYSIYRIQTSCVCLAGGDR